ncbi:MAG TPA: ATP-binding protein [Spirochaetales bacterium]|nr:ATP-binding protein [Spirochaetales bacterium]HRY53860.1 ATP-binding protein [Spirochaetia bacterium]
MAIKDWKPGLRFQLLGTALLVLAFGVGAFLFFSAQVERRVVADLRLMALSFPTADLAALSGRPEDEGMPEYARLRLCLDRILRANPSFKYAYLFTLREGKEIALASTPSEPGSPPDGPGTVYGLSDPAEDRFFAGEADSIVFDAYTDPWGSWVSVAVPALRDGSSGAVLAAFGVDIPVGRWRGNVAAATLLAALLFLLLCVLALLVADRTSRLRRSAELLAAEDRRRKELAEASEKAEREFLALMSHEIRNPLSAIVGFSRLLSETKLDAEQRDQVEMLRSSSDHLMGLVNDILDFSKIEAGHMEIHPQPFDPVRLGKEVVALFSLEALRKGLELRLEEESPSCPPYLLGDQMRVRQIVVNLVSNAVKFTERGNVALRLSYGYGHEGSGLRVCVRDTGPGMDAETMARLFMPFRQGEAGARSGGTGLGLAISKNLVELMGGSIAAGSDLGKGSVFTVQLPLPPCEAPAEELEELESPLAGLRVIAADDDPANRALVSSLLSRRGAAVSPAADGREALAALVAGLGTGGVDAAVIDRSMPGLPGPEVARRFREAERDAGQPRLRLVALTASVSEEGERECLEAGFDAVLAKPFDPDRLAAALLPSGLQPGSAGGTCSDRAAPDRAPPKRASPGPRGREGGLVDEEALLARAEGDAELAEILREAFAESLKSSVEDAEAALASGELAAARAAAHKLRGSALNACAQAVAAAAAALESAAAGGDPAEAAGALARLAAFRAAPRS